MFKVVTGSIWNVYITGPNQFVEVYYVSFPRLDYNNCLIKEQQNILKDAIKSAQVICDRFNNDGRFDATDSELIKAFNREWNI